jgi:hypothetical protein
MISKTKLIETLNDLPDEFSLDELVERLIVIQKVEEAQKQTIKGQIFSEDEAKYQIKKWSK